MRYIILSVCSAFAKNTKWRLSAPIINKINFVRQSLSHLTIRVCFMWKNSPSTWSCLGPFKRLQIRALLTTQPVRYHSLSYWSVLYHKLPPPSMLRPATSQARLHGVLGWKSSWKSMCVGQSSEVTPLKCCVGWRSSGQWSKLLPWGRYPQSQRFYMIMSTRSYNSEWTNMSRRSMGHFPSYPCFKSCCSSSALLLLY
jgi:hypothetical protein